jgi:iron(III) transport system ATP-binding protein
LKFSGFNKKDIADRARAGLELVGLGDLGSRLPSQLSGGQQQRVAVARALVLEPQVLLFDEPLSNLDAKLRRRVREEIREIQQKLGLTVVYVTHDQEEALAVSDRIIVMNNAVIAQDGTPRELYETPADAFVADFIGEANIFDCMVESVSDGLALVRLGPLTIKLAARTHTTGPARIAARPSRLELRASGDPGTLPGTLEKVTYVGSHLEYVVQTEFGEVFLVSPDVDAGRVAGQAVGVAFPARGPVLIPA